MRMRVGRMRIGTEYAFAKLVGSIPRSAIKERYFVTYPGIAAACGYQPDRCSAADRRGARS